ncbi:MAG: type II toxin-antitoxin system PemK/MazF family toxin [bacterium]
MVSYQWGIFWANLFPTRGSEQSGTRPVLVISSEEVNQALPIVTVISLTSIKPGRKVYPTEVFLRAKDTGLQKDSLAMVHQIRAISKERIIEKCGSIEGDELKNAIRKATKIYLDIE